jgi:hypothetical protein
MEGNTRLMTTEERRTKNYTVVWVIKAKRGIKMIVKGDGVEGFVK